MHGVAVSLLAFFLTADLSDAPGTLDAGYREMYNLQFEAAHRTFAVYERMHPEDPLGPASDAAAWMFAEFDRLQILQSEFFVQDSSFTHPRKLNPDPEVRRQFNAALEHAQSLVDAALRKNPNDTNSLFASILVQGLRADYDGLVDKRYLSAVSTMKAGRLTAEKLLAIDSGFYDAPLAIGVENYILSLKPAPLRWMLRLAGAEVSREKGVEQLRITAEKGHYLKPYARLLLAVAALRDNDRGRAEAILADLAREFPGNRLYTEELNRIRRGAGAKP